MRKIRLELEALAVESFATERGTAGRGTVRGNVFTVGYECPMSYDFGCMPSEDWCTDSVSGAYACICDSAGQATCMKCRTDEATCNTCWQTCACA